MEGQTPPVEPPDGQMPEGEVGQTPKKSTDTGGSGTSDDRGQTPEPLTAEYVKELRQEARATRKQLEAAEARLRDFEDREKTEQQKLAERAERAEQAAADATGRLLRFEVAADKKLTSDWVERLRGETREELEADADRLLAQLAEQYQPPPTRTTAFDGGARQKSAEKRSPEEEHNQFLLGLVGRKPTI